MQPRALRTDARRPNSARSSRRGPFLPRRFRACFRASAKSRYAATRNRPRG
jgi:hypothetical protein